MGVEEPVQPVTVVYAVVAGESVDALRSRVATGALLGEVILCNVETPEAIATVKELVEKTSIRCSVEGCTDPDAVTELLNSGVVKAVLSREALAQVAGLPSERIGVRLAMTNTEDLIEQIKSLVGIAKHFTIDFGRTAISDVTGVLANLGTNLPDNVALAATGTATDESDLTFTKAFDKARIQTQLSESMVSSPAILASALASTLTSDRPDGLWTTMVVDERRLSLGLAYSSNESLTAAMDKRRGIYQSRKRGLWVKGETSGTPQDLLAIEVDCDRDTLMFIVKQHGSGYCHRQSLYTCTSPRRGIGLLENTLQQRLTSAPEGSYTKRLFDDAELLKSKLVEEAIELSEADTKEEVANEAADVLYFSMVACAKKGVTFSDIENVLDQRHLKIKRRPGNAKPEFIAKHTQPNESVAVPSQSSQGATKESTPRSGLRRIAVDEVPPLHRDPVDPRARAIADEILTDIRSEGEPALLRHAIRLGDIKQGESHVMLREDLKKYYDSLPEAERSNLNRTADRIKQFAEAQRSSLQSDCTVAIAGGEAGQSVAAVEIAGCYAPGGRYPLPSSVLMGAVTARVAGVKTVWVASPHPQPVVCAAAYVAGANGLLKAGGAQAIGAFAYGAGQVPICDAIVGPGNKFVTAAKSLVAGAVAIDMLAGPSECLVIADDAANPKIIAADLLAQSEHDVAARAILVSTSQKIIGAVDKEIEDQLSDLPTAATARVAIQENSFSILVKDLKEAADVSNRIAPEHLELQTRDPVELAKLMTHYGALFIGQHAAEVLGDYGAGPNHTLPTGGTARSFGGLSVHTFLRPRTWLRIDDLEKARVIVQDAVDLALMEGLHGHSRAASIRLV